MRKKEKKHSVNSNYITPQIKKSQRTTSDPSDIIYKSIFNSTSDAIFIHDPQSGKILEINPSVTDIYGYSRDEILNQTVKTLSSGVQPYREKDAAEWLRKAVKYGPQEFDWQAKKKDGTVFWVRVRLKYVELGTQFRVLALVRNIDAQKRMELKLAEKIEQYENLFNASPSGIVLEDANGIILDVNKALLNIFGYTREEIIGQHISVFTTNNTRALIDKNIKKLLKGQELRQVLESKRKDGKIIYMDLHESRVKLTDGSFGILSIAEDITETKIAQDKLKESEAWFRTMFYDNQAVMLVVDPVDQQKILDANNSAVKFYGYSREKMLSMNMGQINIMQKQKREELMKKAVQKPANYFQFKHVLADGTIKDVEIYASPFVSNGQQRLFIIVHDVSLRRETEKQVHRLATLVEQAVESILITDIAGIIEYVNPAFETITGYSKDEAIGKTPSILKSGKHDEAFYKDLWDTILSGKRWQKTIINKRKNGELYHEQAVIFPIKDEQGTIINFAAILRDITQEQLLEAQVKQLQKMEAIGTLAGGIAHDFNNILTVINGHAEIAMMRADKESKIHHDLVSILGAGKRAAKLTAQLLAFSRKQVHEKRIVDINAVILNMDKMIRRLISEDIDIDIKLENNLPKISADEAQIEQIIMNLIINARDAINEVKLKGSSRKITLGTRYIQSADTLPLVNKEMLTEYIAIEVRDTGIGMDMEVRNRIFEPFFTTKGVTKGTGLGLSTVYGIVKQNAGHILVESRPGEGSVFTIFWPITNQKEQSDLKQEGVPETIHGTESILLVEDDETVSGFAANALQELGYQVVTAKNGQKAIELLNKMDTPVDMVITDMIMPEMNGNELAQKIKDRIPLNRILFVSGYPFRSLVKDGALEEGIHFLQKPYSIVALAKKMRTIFEEQ